MTIDPGKYNKNQKEYSNLVNKLYEKYPQGITLPPEYSSFVHEDLTRFLIRLARYKFVAKLLRKNDTVLEVGSGSGLGTIFLSQYCRQATGLEIKKTEIEEAKSINKRENVSFILQDLFSYSTAHKFDAVCALDVIEHMDETMGKKLVSAMAKHLNKNGMIIIGTPSIYSYPYQGKLSQASHVKCYDQEELQNLIEQYFGRSIAFSMNDEVIHTGNPKMSWYYFILAFNPKT